MKILISIEAPPGSGKSLIFDFIKHKLRSKGLIVTNTFQSDRVTTFNVEGNVPEALLEYAKELK